MKTNAQTWTRTETLQQGDEITFRPRYLDHDVTATVVSITRFAHCVGASSFNAYSLETGVVYGLDLIGGNYKTTTRAQTETEANAKLEAARADYRARLSVYPAWRENFAKGISIGF